jgi:hypothetical protein
MANKKSSKQKSLPAKDKSPIQPIDILPQKKNNTTKTRKSKPTKAIEAQFTPTPVKFVPRLLCFSNIDADVICPYHYIQNIVTQSYTNAHYIFNIFVSSKDDELVYKKILKPFFNPSTMKFTFFLKDLANIQNHLVGFLNTEYKNYNMFAYLDPNGVYQPTYLQNLVDQYDHSIDIVTIKFYRDSSGAYNYILNNKSLDILMQNRASGASDWLGVIKEHNLNTKDIEDKTSLVFKSAIHKTKDILVNASSPEQNYQLIEHDFFTLCVFEHYFWSSFVYLNNRNHRMYNVVNDDHGAFEIQSDNTIKIKWDTWGDETFYKKYVNDNIYYYSINP